MSWDRAAQNSRNGSWTLGPSRSVSVSSDVPSLQVKNSMTYFDMSRSLYMDNQIAHYCYARAHLKSSI